jgi:hypothetical protein
MPLDFKFWNDNLKYKFSLVRAILLNDFKLLWKDNMICVIFFKLMNNVFQYLVSNLMIKLCTITKLVYVYVTIFLIVET